MKNLITTLAALTVAVSTFGQLNPTPAMKQMINSGVVPGASIAPNSIPAASVNQAQLAAFVGTNTFNVLLPVANTNVLILSGFGAGWDTILNADVGPTTNLSAANAYYFWSNSVAAYKSTNGFGVVHASGNTWLTNAVFPYDPDAISALAALQTDTAFDSFSSVLWLDGTGAGTGIPIGNAESLYQTNNTAPAFVGPSLSPGVRIPQLGLSNNLNGSFAGNLAGSSNLSASAIAPFTLSTTNMDNATWLGWLSGNFSSFTNSWGRYGTSNTFYAIRHRLPITVLFQGNGWVNEANGANFDWEFKSLTNMFPVRGFVGNPYSVNGSGAMYAPINVLNGVQGPVSISNRDTNWWAGYIIATSLNAGFQIAPSYTFPCDIFEVDWVSTKWGGNFTVATNNGSGWHILTTLSGFTAAQAGNVFKWTNTTLSSTMQIAFTNTAAGTNNFIAFGFFNSALTNGVTFMQQGLQGTGPCELEAVASSVRAPIYASWNPNLILDLWSVGDSSIPCYVAERDFYRTNHPYADVVQCWQFLLDNVDPAAGLGRETVPLTCAQTNGTMFFNGGVIGGNFFNLSARGLTANDHGHLSTAGYDFYGKLLWNWLGLTERH